MIVLSKIRLINWYGFSSVTVPVGFFTLIAGKNGNGKSVLLDGVKYALYGDTVFNKSTENKGSRTLSSYTRGLLDATAGSYMRPADKMPNINTHIVLEMYEKELERYFILGTVIETNAANGIVTQRYVIEGKRLDEMEHTYEEDGLILIYNGAELQKKYGFKMMSASDGLAKFMQRTGLRLNEGQLAAFRRKLRSIMSYDPNARIDRFIRENVLEEKKVDFSKLIEKKNTIDKLTESFAKIDAEIRELEEIISCFEELKRARNVLFADDVRNTYKLYLEEGEKCERSAQEMSVALRQIREDDEKLAVAEDRESRTRSFLDKAKRDLEQMDCARAIREAKEALEEAGRRKEALLKERNTLLELQRRIDGLCRWLRGENISVPDQEILSSLTLPARSGARKENSVGKFIKILKEHRDNVLRQMVLLENDITQNEAEQKKCRKVIADCDAKRTTFDEIPDYMALKNEINAAFRRRGIKSEARFACEYVIGLKDEAWRDVIEGYLGRRRYTILVEPEYYDLADEIFNASRNRYAHLFNTKLLMKKEIRTEKDSVVKFVEIKNAAAKKYFDYQLGRFHAVDINQVKNYENAMSKEGRVSVAMDCYFIRFRDIRYYYLGQETLMLNKNRAERRMDELKSIENGFRDHLDKAVMKKSYLETELEMLVPCNYNACQDYEAVLQEVDRRKEALKGLEDAQKNNMEYMQLARRAADLQGELDSIVKVMDELRYDRARQRTIFETNEREQKRAEAAAAAAEEKLKEKECVNSAVYAKAVADYDRYVEAGKTGPGGPLKDRARAERVLREAGENLRGAQCAYNAFRTPENQLPAVDYAQAVYQERMNRIWMDDRQEIREELKRQTEKYEAIFKNEFVLTVLKSCDAAKANLKLINAELARLNFQSVYAFDVSDVKDGSDYEKILEYARYLRERERMGTASGQMTLDMMTAYSNDRGEELEQGIEQIVNRIVSGEDREQIERYADYRNYMNYEILVSNKDVLHKARLSRQSGYNSGAEVQIPYMLILLSALLLIYDDKSSSTRLVFIDEPFAKMDPVNIKIMLAFMRRQKLQMIFCAPDKTELIGNECEVLLPVLRTRPDLMEIGSIEMHEGV